MDTPATTLTARSKAAKKGPIAKCFDECHNEDQPILERVRTCAQLTIPWVLPPLNQDANTKLPQNFQSIGSRGIITMVGKMLMVLWPADLPWFDMVMGPKEESDPNVSDKDKQAVRDLLFAQKLILMMQIESSEIDPDESYRGAAPFRTAKRNAITQLLVTGDTMEQFTDNYRIKVFRRDQYVVRRDTEGCILFSIVQEAIDAKTLRPKWRGQAEITDEMCECCVSDRMVPIYTKSEWDPTAKKWSIEQEVNGHTIVTSKETVNPFMVTPYELTAGEHYGRGFVELNLGDLSSLDTLCERELDFAALASKLLQAIDYGSEIREEDLTKKTGSMFRARVEGGVVQDTAFLNVNKTADFNVVFTKTANLRKELGGAMLIESEVTPAKERTTATQVQRVAQEVSNATSGQIAPIEEHQHGPLLRRLIFQARKDKLIRPLPKKTVNIRLLTGLAAIAQANKANQLQGFLSSISAFPTLLQRVNQEVLMKVLVRAANINEPGLVKTEEEVAKDLQAAIASQAQQALNQKVIDTGGDIVSAHAQPRTA